MLFNGCTKGETENALPGFGNQTEVTVRIEERGDFIFIPGPVKTLGIISSKYLFADMKDFREIIDRHIAKTNRPVTVCS